MMNASEWLRKTHMKEKGESRVPIGVTRASELKFQRFNPPTVPTQNTDSVPSAESHGAAIVKRVPLTLADVNDWLYRERKDHATQLKRGNR
jgi:hypothetical protein